VVARRTGGAGPLPAARIEDTSSKPLPERTRPAAPRAAGRLAGRTRGTRPVGRWAGV